MLVVNDIGCVRCLRMGGGNICQNIDFFRPLADFIIYEIFLFSSVPITSPRCRSPSVGI